MNTTTVTLSDLHSNSHQCGQSCRRRGDIAGTWVAKPCGLPVTRALVNTDDGRAVIAFCTKCTPKVSSWADEVAHFSIVEVTR